MLRGEFKDEALGEKYLLLNLLRGSDLAAVKALCADTDASKTQWNSAIDGLAATVETFHENPDVPGQFIPDDDKTVTVGVQDLTEVKDDDTAVDSYALSASGPGQGFVTIIVGNGEAFTPPGEPVSVYVLRVSGPLYTGELKIIPSPNPLNEQLTIQHSADLAGRFADYEYEWKIAPPVDGLPPALSPTMAGWIDLANGQNIPFYTLGGTGIRVLIDNYLVMRYRAKHADHPLFDVWSDWTRPQLAEGWIKRVLAGINPFNPRVNDLFNNQVNTDVSLITQAGRRWEGDVALNLENINNFGLIEIYETVLRRGKMLSIDAGINFGPANDALLLAAGYLNDLHMMIGNEAWADAANPTIGIGTKDKTDGDIATALFAFKGQTASLLEEELALLRGRDDFLQPGVEITPVYNRLVWNYTRGIDAGEVIYALKGYRGMDNSTVNTSAVAFAGGSSPSDLSATFLDSRALSANPYVYLIPVGVDSMRTPPLGDASGVRTWSVEDIAVPLPFNIGASDFSTKALYQSSDSLTDTLFNTRKHQAFRPVASVDFFDAGLSISTPTQYTNRRLIGRSAWNSKWKLVIPGRTLLRNPDEGLDRFIQTVKDIIHSPGGVTL